MLVGLILTAWEPIDVLTLLRRYDLALGTTIYHWCSQGAWVEGEGRYEVPDWWSRWGSRIEYVFDYK